MAGLAGWHVPSPDCHPSDTESCLLLVIQDTGHGIQPENLERIFEPLFTTKTKGIGLGLAISKKLVEANGGWIEVDSRPGEGATFRLYLPLAA